MSLQNSEQLSNEPHLQRITPLILANRLQESKISHIEDAGIWIRRPLYGLSYRELAEVTRLFDKDKVVPKLGKYSLSIVINGEIQTVLKGMHIPAQELDMILQMMMMDLPDSAHNNVIAVTEPMQQFTDWIAIRTEYPAFEEERAFIAEYFKTTFGIGAYDWDMTPHISLARGLLSDVENSEEIQEAIPRYVQLSPMKKKQNFPDDR